MDYLQGTYLVAALGLVAYVYRSTFKAVVRRVTPILVLFRPLAVLAMAYISGLNVPSIAESFAGVIPPSITEPLAYVVTLLALLGLSFVSFLRPAQDDTRKPM